MGKPFSYGGQAVMEGVMMRGAKNMCVAVRAPDGEIIIHCEPLNPRIYASSIAKIPFVRGLTMLWDALGLGIRALVFSADVAVKEEDDEIEWDSKEPDEDELDDMVEDEDDEIDWEEDDEDKIVKLECPKCKSRFETTKGRMRRQKNIFCTHCGARGGL